MDKKETLSTNENLIFLLLPSLLGIGISLFFLVGLTFAWFNTSISTTGQNLVAATFDVTMTIKNITDNMIIDNTEKTYTLDEGNYEITIRRSGTSIDSVGYAVIKIGETSYNTHLLNKNEDLIFQINTDVPLTIETKPIWGSYGIDDNSPLTNNTKIDNITKPPVEETTPEPVEEYPQPEPDE